MIRIQVSDRDLASLRIAISPLWEASTSLLLVQQKDVPWPYDGWARQARAVLARADVEPLAPFFRQGPLWIPDFLSPTPSRSQAPIEEELAAVRSVPAEVVRAVLAAAFPDGAPPELRPFHERPEEALARYADAMLDYWQDAIAPHWPRMQAVLERDVLRRARVVAATGAADVLGDLHPRIRWQRPTIEIEKYVEADIDSSGRGLVLVPLVFSPGALLVSTDEPDRLALSYPVSGVADVWDSEPAADDDRLELLLGRGRAAVVRALAEPQTTLGLAALLDLAPSSVSQHLAVLTRARLVTRMRSGRRVYYRLNEDGLALGALLSDPDESRLIA